MPDRDEDTIDRRSSSAPVTTFRSLMPVTPRGVPSPKIASTAVFQRIETL